MQETRSSTVLRSLASTAVLAVLLASAGSQALAQDVERGRKGKPRDRQPIVLEEDGGVRLRRDGAHR